MGIGRLPMAPQAFTTTAGSAHGAIRIGTGLAATGSMMPRRDTPAIAAARRELDRTLGTDLERAFDVVWHQHQFTVPDPIPQHRFALPRQFRFDRAWPAIKVAVELDGGIYMQVTGGKSRHVTPTGYEGDCRKTNLACSKQWLVFRLTRGMLKEGEQLELVAATVAHRMKLKGYTNETYPTTDQLSLGDALGRDD